MSTAATVVGVLLVLAIAGFGITMSITGAVWAARRVGAGRGPFAAAFAAVAFGGILFIGGWIIFGPAWLIGAVRRRTRPGPRRSARFVLATIAAVAALAVVFAAVVGVKDRHRLAQRRTLERDGIRTAATVVSVHYIADSDPGGWSAIYAVFVDEAGAEHQVAVGHHFPDRHRIGSSIPIVYDPKHPQVASDADGHFDEYPDSVESALDVGMASIALLVLAAAIAFLSRPERANVRPGWYADPWSPADRRYWDGHYWTGYAAPRSD